MAVCFAFYSNFVSVVLHFVLLYNDNLILTGTFSVNRWDTMIRSAINYLSQAGNQLLQLQSAYSADAKSHPLLGQTLTIGDHSYVVRSLLAEGGYALVFAVEATKNDRSTNGGGGQWYALKRLLAADQEAADAVVREINFLKQLNGHPSIVRFCHAQKHRGGGTAKGGAGVGGRLSSSFASAATAARHHFCEFFVLTELCSGGPLIDLLRRGPLSVEQVCKILYATAQAINHMHDRNPPITHRDIKVENLLFDAHGQIKLCDFGSATTDIYRPCDEWSALVRAQLEEEIAKFTTPMYRAPEVLDTYQNFPIGPAQDVWALGCVLFYLCYRVHPFEDSAKLRILNANYKLPAQSDYQAFHDLIKQTLQPDPYSRPSIQDLCEQIEDLAMALGVPLGQPVLSADQLQMLRDKQQPITSDASSSTSKTTTTEPATITARNSSSATSATASVSAASSTTSSSGNAGRTTVVAATNSARSTPPTAHNTAEKGANDVVDQQQLLLLQELSLICDRSEGGGRGVVRPSSAEEQILLSFEMPTATTTASRCPSGTTTGTTPTAASDDGLGTTKKVLQQKDGGGNLEDILSAMYGFTSSTKVSNRSLADMAKESEAQLTDPLSVKIREWTSGKERNIRALIGSLSAVLWAEAAQQWKQPTMAELFAAENVKKHYRRACLVVHPDKQMGTVHEPLAKAIFTELNDAWTEFRKNSD